MSEGHTTSAGAPRRRTRVAFVIDAHPDALIGGAQYQAALLAELLADRDDVELRYITRFAPKQRERDGYRIVRFGSTTGHGRLRMLRDLPSLYRRLREFQPDVVYQRCLTPFTGACAWYCRRHGAKFVYHVASDRDTDKSTPIRWTPHGVLQWFARQLGSYGLRRADIVVAQTEQQASTLRTEHGFESVLVVRNFHPVPKLEPLRPPRDRVRIIWVANFKPFKRPDIFVDVAEALRHRDDAEFVMIGRPGPRHRFATVHEHIGKQKNLRYLGELPIERVEEEIAASDIFVNTSLWEGFPNSFIHAWLRGVPVVSCFIDPDRCFTQGGAGLHAGGVGRLIDILERLLDEPAQLRELGKAGRAHALAHHSPQAALPLVEALATIGRKAGGFGSAPRPPAESALASATPENRA